MSPEELEFGLVGPGGYSKNQFASLTNVSSSNYGPINLTFDAFVQAPEDPDDSWSGKDFDCIGATLAPGQSCKTAWQFRPIFATELPDSATLQITEGTPPTNAQTAVLQLHGSALVSGMGDLLQESATLIKFPDGPDGQGSVEPFTLTNISNGFLGPLQFTEDDFIGLHYQVLSNNCDGATLGLGAACTIQYKWTPSGPCVCDAAHDFHVSLRDFPEVSAAYEVDLDAYWPE